MFRVVSPPIIRSTINYLQHLVLVNRCFYLSLATGRNNGWLVEWKRNLVAHGEAREEKWRGKRRMEWVASSLALYRNTVYPALLPLMRTPRLPAADWTDTPADINGLVRFTGRPNLVCARVPSHSVFTLPGAMAIGSNNGWLVPGAVDTVNCAPDDGWRNHPKRVEQFADKISCV